MNHHYSFDYPHWSAFRWSIWMNGSIVVYSNSHIYTRSIIVGVFALWSFGSKAFNKFQTKSTSLSTISSSENTLAHSPPIDRSFPLNPTWRAITQHTVPNFITATHFSIISFHFVHQIRIALLVTWKQKQQKNTKFEAPTTNRRRACFACEVTVYARGEKNWK